MRLRTRLIPARAGNISSPVQWSCHCTAHPRSRGEHFWAGGWHWCGSGSSPLARGTFRPHHHRHVRHRLIPARAGNIRGCVPAIRARAAHPRSRGEHIAPRRTSSSSGGSSPLARGTFFAEITRRPNERLIPARAGNIVKMKKPHVAPTAHPRSRGEHVARRWSITCTPGSSPLARGTFLPISSPTSGLRLIPARAGNIGPVKNIAGGGAAHPRSRGEH